MGVRCEGESWESWEKCEVEVEEILRLGKVSEEWWAVGGGARDKRKKSSCCVFAPRLERVNGKKSSGLLLSRWGLDYN